MDDLEKLICDNGVKSGRCSGGTQKAGLCKDPALSRPGEFEFARPGLFKTSGVSLCFTFIMSTKNTIIAPLI